MAAENALARRVMQLEVGGGVSLHVEELGPSDSVDRAGPTNLRSSASPVILVHGLLVGNMATFYFTLAPLLAKTRRVVLYDLRGHGTSTRAKTGYDVPTMARDLACVAERVAGAPATIVGHSYGAVVAMDLAKERPELVEKLVVIEAPLPPSGLEELDSFVGKDPEAMLEALPEGLRAVVASGGRRGRRFVDAMRFLATESSLFDDLRGAKDFSDEELARIACPTLAVYGTRSSCRPVGKRLAHMLPRASLVEIEGGHFLPIESPGPLSDRVVPFVNASTPRSIPG